MKNYFSRLEIALWSSSVLLIVVSFCLFDKENYVTLLASLIGVTSLIFSAKGHPFGQLLMVLFSLLYGLISYRFHYYGEMITYLGMTMPMALICFFLGGLGIHNFMMGETKKGIVKIVLSLCLGIGGILALIDFIKILMDKYVIDPEKAC